MITAILAAVVAITPEDAAFMLAQDESMFAPYTAMSGDPGRLLSMLGSDDYRAREAASRTLVEAGDAAVPILVRGYRSSDPEVHLRCYSLLGRYVACEGCQGVGYTDGYSRARPCETCHGYGRKGRFPFLERRAVSIEPFRGKTPED